VAATETKDIIFTKKYGPKSHPCFEENKVEIARFRPLWVLACPQNIFASFLKIFDFPI
jgi:hypothetical protein